MIYYCNFYVSSLLIVYKSFANQSHPFITLPILLLLELIILICCTNVLPIITNLSQCFTLFTNDYQKFANTSLPIIALVISSSLVASVLINLPMALGNLPAAANALPLVLIGNDTQESSYVKQTFNIKITWTCWAKHKN